MSKTAYLMILQLILMVWSASGIIGGNLQISSETLTFYRMLIAFLSLIIPLCLWHYHSIVLSKSHTIQALIAGVVLSIHWLCFFYSIKISTVSIGLVCLSAGPFFACLLTPLMTKSKFQINDLILGLLVIIALGQIFRVETNYTQGIVIGLVAAFAQALNSVMTEKISHFVKPTVNIAYQCFSGCFCLFLWFITQGKTQAFYLPSTQDYAGVLFLGLFCTNIALVFYTICLEKLGTFTVILSVNMEPIYGVILALWVNGKSEIMSDGFYTGALLLLICVFLDLFIKNKKTKLKRLSTKRNLSPSLQTTVDKK